MARSRAVIPLADYERVFRLICGVLDSRANTPHACIFFSLVGAAVLEKHYKVKANPVAGAAAYAVNSSTGTVSTFGKLEEDQLISTRDAFHCWIESQGIVIDFMAPLFEDSLKTYGHHIAVPAKMFQRPRAEMSNTVHDLRAEGDFHLNPNPELAQEVFKDFANHLAATDLANVVLHWYRRPPMPLPEGIGMQDDLGNVYKLQLKGPQLVGIW